jgi:Sulfotransferase family
MASLGKLQTSTIGRRESPGLDADEMIASALARAGRRDFSDRSFVDPLRRLVRSYNSEADLGAFGRRAVRFDVMRALKNLIRFDRMEETRPEILARPIQRPIFITGLPRSGTTFLHTLLAQDPGIAVPLSWQLVYPYPSRLGALGADFRSAWVDMQFQVMLQLSPELKDLHPLSANTPQECTDITAQVFQSLRFDSTYRIPSYQDWLDHHGHHDAYRFHRRFLQHLDSQNPGRRWVLKSPDHVFALDAIKAVYPYAQIVFLHRDPLSVLASVAKLTEVLRRPFGRSVNRMEIGQQVSSSWLDGAGRMIAASAHDPSILHLHYRDVVSAPFDAVGTLYRHCGLELGDGARRRMQAWLNRSPQNGNGQSRYSLTEFGMDAGALRDRFGRYMDEFSVATEWDPARSGALHMA